MEPYRFGNAWDWLRINLAAFVQQDGGEPRRARRGPEHRTDHVCLIAFQPDVERVAGNTGPGRRDHGPVGETPLMLVMPPRPRRERIGEAEVERRDDPQRPCNRLARNRDSACFCRRVRLSRACKGAVHDQIGIRTRRGVTSPGEGRMRSKKRCAPRRWLDRKVLESRRWTHTAIP